MRLTRWLELPVVYDCFQYLSGGASCRKTYISRHIQPQTGHRVLDIGCGTGDMLCSFPAVEYHGFDPSPEYIERARARGIPNSHFQCGVLTADNLEHKNYFDIVHSSGVLHHIDDQQAVELMQVAYQALKVGGKFYTLDGCFHPQQSWLEQRILRMDRGKFVRDETGYAELARTVFKQVEQYYYPNLLRPLPYPVLVMCMTKVES